MANLIDIRPASEGPAGLLTAEARPVADGRVPQALATGRDRITRAALAVADAGAVLTAAAVVTVAPGRDWLTPWALLLCPVVVVLARVHGLYGRDDVAVTKRTLDEAPGLAQLALAMTLLFWLGEGLFVVGALSHGQALAFLVGLLAALLTCRGLMRWALVAALPNERVLVIGDESAFRRLALRVDQRFAGTTELLGRLDLGEVHLGGPAAVSPHDVHLATLVRDLGIDRIVVAPGAADPDLAAELVREAGALGVPVTVAPRVLDLVGTRVVVDDVAGMTLLGVSRVSLSRSSLALKRSLDVAASAVTLLASAPLFAACAVAIKLDCPGPVLFRQTRIGRDGKPFEMYKFRTMVPDAEQRKHHLLHHNETQGLFKIADDPRITRVGALLRRASLDELPQLLNVLRGEMSIVGPRPLVPDEDATVAGGHRRRLALLPGMTGPWQILGSHRVPLADMVEMDGAYVATWSLWLDLKIMLRTVPHVLLRRGL